MQLPARLLAIGLLSSPAIAQSPEEYQLLRGIQRQAIESEMDWNQSIKLTKDGIAKIDKPQDMGRFLQLDEIIPGSIGKLEYWQGRVRQVIDADSFLGIVGNRDFLIKHPTELLSTNAKFRIVGPVKIGKPTAYTTIAGARRDVLVIEFISDEEYKKHLGEQNKASFPKYKLASGETFQGRLKSFSKGNYLFTGLDEADVTKKFTEFDRTEVKKLNAEWKVIEAKNKEDSAHQSEQHQKDSKKNGR